MGEGSRHEAPVALISGASRGIGAEIARELAAGHGFVVYAGGRNPQDVSSHHGLERLQLDVTDQASVDAARDRIESEVGHLDALVNNAGIYGDPTGAADYDLDRAHEVLEVNTFGPWRLIEAFLPLLRRSDQPRIVNVSSGAGQLSDMNGGRAAYRVSKAALNALTRTLASDERWVKVNTMCPGWVRTDMGGAAAPRSVEQGADTAVWLATLPDDGPTGGFFRDRTPIPW
jgi:NAD(P)-dependent dehydrogenase (short-subunit alcohol dehydrogenase family)